MHTWREVRNFAWQWVWLFFKLKNPTPVETPATIIDPTIIYPCFNLRNKHIESCYCRNGKLTPDPGPDFHKFLTTDPGPKKKRRILPESTPVFRIRSHLWSKYKPEMSGVWNFSVRVQPWSEKIESGPVLSKFLKIISPIQSWYANVKSWAFLPHEAKALLQPFSFNQL